MSKYTLEDAIKDIEQSIITRQSDIDKMEIPERLTLDEYHQKTKAINQLKDVIYGFEKSLTILKKVGEDK